MISAIKSNFQFWNFEVKKRASATTGAIDPWARSERIAHREKSLDPVLAWSLDSSKTITSMGMVKKYNLHESQGVLFTQIPWPLFLK
jgi:hypothetical protein